MNSNKIVSIVGLVFSLFLFLPTIVAHADGDAVTKTITFADGCWEIGDLRGCVYENDKNQNRATGGNHLGEGITIAKYTNNKYCLEVPLHFEMSGITLNQTVFAASQTNNCYTYEPGSGVWRLDFGVVFVGERTPEPTKTEAPRYVVQLDDRGCWARLGLSGCVYTNDKNTFNASLGNNNVTEGFAIHIMFDNSRFCVVGPQGYAVNGVNINGGSFVAADSNCHVKEDGQWRVDFGVALVGTPAEAATVPPTDFDLTEGNGCFFVGQLQGCVYLDDHGLHLANGGNHVGPGARVEFRDTNKYCLVAPEGFMVTGFNLNQTVYLPVSGKPGTTCYTYNNTDVTRLDFALGVDPDFVRATPVPTATPDPDAEVMGTVNLINITRTGACKWTVTLSMTGFHSDSLLAQETTAKQSDCAGNESESMSVTETGHFIQADVTGAVTWTREVNFHGIYTTTITDEQGRKGTLTYNIQP